MGSSPARWVDTATPFRVWVWSTHLASWRAAWMALWMTKPAGFTGNGESSTLLPSQVDLHQAGRGDLVEEQAVGIDEELVLGARAPARVMCVKTRSSQP